MSQPYFTAPAKSSGARTASVLFGVPAALLVGALVWLRSGSAIWAGLAAVAIFVLALYSAIAASRGPSIVVALVMVGLVVGSLYYGVSQALAIYRAISTTEGPVDAADPEAAAAARSAIAHASDQNAFRIEMTEEEIGAFLQDGLREVESNPIRRIDVDITDRGQLSVAGRFKSGNVDFSGTIGFTLDAGAIQVDVIRLELGDLDLPGIGRDAIEDILAEVADLNEALLGLDADVQSIALGNDRLVVTGTQGGGAMVTSAALLDAIAAQAAAVGSDVEAPPTRIGPGLVDSLSAPGSPVVVALGDSLAANVGVDRPRRGYVSRVHAEFERRDDADYGLQNFGISGETTGTMIRGGQLDLAVSYLGGADVAYVVVDIGANDLLGHLGSADCSDDIDSDACTRRLKAAFDTYERNLATILDRLDAAAPEATIVYLTAYNPFSLGLSDVGFEQRSDEILAAFNAIGAGIAGERGVIVADGFSPMRGLTAATTHMLDPLPDIHPNAIGYDVLAWAIVQAVYGP